MSFESKSGSKEHEIRQKNLLGTPPDQELKVYNPSIELIFEVAFSSGTNSSIPMILKTFQNSKGIIHTLYFVRNNHGFCLHTFVYPPEGTSDKRYAQENAYWEWLMQEVSRSVYIDYQTNCEDQLPDTESQY